MVDGFLKRWRIVSNMTVDFLEAASEELLDFRPGLVFRTVREQAVHLTKLRGIYQSALAGQQPDYSRGEEFAPASAERLDIVEGLRARDRELEDLLEAIRPAAETVRLAWHNMSIADFEVHHVQHETLHHGQWIAHASLLGHAQPTAWVRNWSV